MNTSKKIILSLLILGVSLSGYTTIQPIQPTTKVHQQLAKNTVIIVPDEYTFHYKDALKVTLSISDNMYPSDEEDSQDSMTFRLPSGKYVPDFEDDDGSVYFKAPDAIVIYAPALGLSLLLADNGWLLINKENKISYRTSSMLPWRLLSEIPADFKYSVINNKEK
jgi:hypothetical protein